MVVCRAWIILLPLASLLGAPVAESASNTEKAGDVLFVLLPVTGFATAYIKHDREGQAQFVKAFAANAIVTFGLKAAIDKTRPDGDCCDSFPSGHASFTFMGASFLQRRYGWKYGLPAYAAATFVAYSRVESDRHFVEDVVAGAAIGFLSSYYFTTRYPGVSIIPVARRDFAGVTFSMQW
jgi:membrane-associated phospholipid phosphatase